MSKDKKLREEIKVLRHQLANAQAQIAFLQQKIDAMAQRMFGKKSEELNSGQMELLLSGLEKLEKQSEDEKDDQEEPPQKHRKPRTGKHSIRTPEDLEVVDEVILPDTVKANPELWKEIGREENKRLDYQPAKFFWRRTIRPKFVHRIDRQMPPVIAAAPLEISLGGKVSAGLLAQVLVNRYCDHLPYYRQQQKFFRENSVWIPRGQLGQWVGQSADQLGRVVDVMRSEIRQRRYLQVDETPIKFQDRDRAGPCPQGWFWSALDPGQAVVFQWHESRGKEGLKALIGNDYRGSLGVDAYITYRSFAKGRPGVQLIGCWSHARRKFHEARPEDRRIAGWFLNQIGLLFQGEMMMKPKTYGPVGRQSLRCSHSQPIIERLERALTLLIARYRPKSLMRQAIDYTLNQWTQLTAFLEHGEAELSNNLVENAIRPSALGKRNWLFIGHRDAGQRSAIIYSLTETCRMLGANPYAYLKDILQRLPGTPDDQVADLTPLNWLTAQASLEKAA